MSTVKWKNPFYTLLIPVGLVFVVTVFAYGFMAFVAVRGTNPEALSHVHSPVFSWLARHGTLAVLVELGVLAVLTVGAIATDSYWTARDKS